jgi:hypothetical protein
MNLLTNVAFGRETTKAPEQAIERVHNSGEHVQLHLKRIFQRDPASYQEQRACEMARILLWRHAIILFPFTPAQRIMKSHPSPLIYCKKVGKCGRGVFARTSIKKGAVIEACPIIVISKKDYKNIAKTVLAGYVFCWGKDDSLAALALGFGGLFNHATCPNAAFKKRISTGEIVFRAIQDIKMNEEIRIDYGYPSPDDYVGFIL